MKAKESKQKVLDVNTESETNMSIDYVITEIV